MFGVILGFLCGLLTYALLMVFFAWRERTAKTREIKDLTRRFNRIYSQVQLAQDELHRAASR